MKSGNKISHKYKFKINFKHYEDLHKDESCSGKWELTFTMGASRCFTIDAIGPVRIPIIPLVTCHACETSYELPKFREFVEKIIATHLIRSNQLLTKRQIHFLRLYFDKTQEEFASKIGLANKQEMSRVESDHSERRLDSDRQVRLRLYCAKLLKIDDLDVVYGVNDIDDSKAVEIPESIFPKTEEEIISTLNKTA